MSIVNQSVVSDRPPDETQLKDGDRLVYLDGQNLVEVIKANGVLFENVIGGDQSEPERIVDSDGTGNWDALDDGLYAGNLELLSNDAVLIAKDAAGEPRAKFGQVITDSFGLQVLKPDGDTEIMGFYGSTANIAGWAIDDNSIGKSIGTGSSEKSIYLSTEGNEPSFVTKFGSLEKLRIGYLDASNLGIKVKDTITGNPLMQISASITGGTDVAKIGGWHFNTTELKSTVTASTAHLKLDSAKMRVSIMDDQNPTGDKIAMGYLEGLVKNKSLDRLINVPVNSSGKAVITLNGLTEEEDEDAMRPGTLDGLHYWASINDTGSTTGISQTAGIPVESNTFNTLTLVAGGESSYAPGYSSAYEFLAAVYASTGGEAQGRYYKLEFQSDDYGFWAKDGDQLRIDGDVVYDSGDWLISSDGSIKFYSAGTEVMRLGTHGAYRGLFIGDGIGSETINARFTAGGFVIGDVAGSTNRIEWTGSALNIIGTITVQDAILPALAAWEKNMWWTLTSGILTHSNDGEAIIYGYSGNGVADKSVDGAFMYGGSKYNIAERQGWATSAGGSQVGNMFWTIATQAPASGVLDGYIVYETLGGTASQPSGSGANCPFHMTSLANDPYYRIAFCTRTTTVAANDVVTVTWHYDPNSSTMTEFTPTSTMVVIGYMKTVTTDEIQYMQMLREAIHIDDIHNHTDFGTYTALTSGVGITGGGIYATGTSSKITMHASDSSVIYDQLSSVFLGLDDGVPKLSLRGSGSGDSLTWNGSTLAIKGDITMDGGSISWTGITNTGTLPYDLTGASAAVQANLEGWAYDDLDGAGDRPLTYIDSGGIYTGVLSAEQINSTGLGFVSIYIWRFHDSNEGFSATNASLTENDFSITLNATGNDPVFKTYSPLTGINGANDRYIKIKIKRTAGDGWVGKVTWTGGNGAPSVYKAFADPSGGVTGDWKYVLLDMHNLTAGTDNWSESIAGGSGTATQIQFLFGADAADTFEIGYIQVGDFSGDTSGTYIDSAGIYTGTLTATVINGAFVSAGVLDAGRCLNVPGSGQAGATTHGTGAIVMSDDAIDLTDLLPTDSYLYYTNVASGAKIVARAFFKAKSLTGAASFSNPKFEVSYNNGSGSGSWAAAFTDTFDGGQSTVATNVAHNHQYMSSHFLAGSFTANPATTGGDKFKMWLRLNVSSSSGTPFQSYYFEAQVYNMP